MGIPISSGPKTPRVPNPGMEMTSIAAKVDLCPYQWLGRTARAHTSSHVPGPCVLLGENRSGNPTRKNTWQIHPGFDERLEPTAINHEKKGTGSEPNLHGIMFHVNLPGCKHGKQERNLDQPSIFRNLCCYFHDADSIFIGACRLNHWWTR